MVNLPMLPDDDEPIDYDTPLPLIVAKRWNFPLASVKTDDGFFYAVHDWIRGLVSLDDVRTLWANFKKEAKGGQMFNSSEQLAGNLIKKLPYKSRDGKTYRVDYTTDTGLYLIAQYLRVKKKRPVLDQIRKFLASAGAFVDEVRLDPEQAIDAGIQGFRAMGRDDAWIFARIQGKIKRNLFTAALSAAVADILKRHHYAMATDDIYKGLWGRTAAYLKKELELPPKANLRDHQPQLALHYQGIAEELAAQDLGEKEEITWNEARKIVQDAASFVAEQAHLTAKRQKCDLATGKSLLK